MSTPSPRLSAILVTLGAALLLPTIVRADAISGPPACPPGSRGRSSHAGQWCEPWTCTADDTCGAAAKCRPWRVCTKASDVEPGGMRAEPAPPMRMQLVVGTCDPALGCRGDEEPPPLLVGKLLADAPQCRDDRHCVADDLPALPPRTGDVAAPPPPSPSPPATTTTGAAPAAPPPGCGCTSTTNNFASLALLALLLRRRRA